MRGFDSCYPCLLKLRSKHIKPNLFKKCNKLSISFRLPKQSVQLVKLINGTKRTFVNKHSFTVLHKPYPKSSLRLNFRKIKFYMLSSKFLPRKVAGAQNTAINLSKIALIKNIVPHKKLCDYLQTSILVASNINYVNFSTRLQTIRSRNNNQGLGRLNESELFSGKGSIESWIGKGLLDFITSSIGTRTLLQFYPFLSSSNIEISKITFYKTWVSRLSFYQRRLGHRFFMEETIHIMHLALSLQDSNFFSKWLASLIKRISFWKTRSIFRYLLYLFNNFFTSEFKSLGCKGLKIRLKGKISAAGNSRKRVIALKFGKVSYSTLSIKCQTTDTLVSTFTGVMNLRIHIFY